MLERMWPKQLALPVPAGRWIDHRVELQRSEWFEVERHRSQRCFRVPVAISRCVLVASVLGLSPEHLLLFILWARVAWQGAGGKALGQKWEG